MTTGQTDGQKPDKVIFMCRYASQATQKYTQQVCHLIMFTRLCVHFDLELSNCPLRSFPSSSCAPSLKNIQQIIWFPWYVHNILKWNKLKWMEKTFNENFNFQNNLKTYWYKFSCAKWLQQFSEGSEKFNIQLWIYNIWKFKGIQKLIPCQDQHSLTAYV